MTPSVLSTRSLHPRDQFDAWRTWFSPVFDISRGRDESCFIAENKVWDLGGLLVSRVSAPSVRVLRARSNLRRAPIDHWVLSYCRHGSTGIRTKASSLVASSGVPYLWSFGDESESERTEVDRIQILLPRDTHGEMASVLDASTGSVLNSPWGHLLGEYMMLLDRWLPHLNSGELPPMTAAVRSMVFACVAPSADRIALANGEIGRVNLERARQAVRGNLKSPSLSPSSLGAIVGIRVRRSTGSLSISAGLAITSSSNACSPRTRPCPILPTDNRSSPFRQASASRMHRLSAARSNGNSVKVRATFAPLQLAEYQARHLLACEKIPAVSVLSTQ